MLHESLAPISKSLKRDSRHGWKSNSRWFMDIVRWAYKVYHEYAHSLTMNFMDSTRLDEGLADFVAAS